MYILIKKVNFTNEFFILVYLEMAIHRFNFFNRIYNKYKTVTFIFIFAKNLKCIYNS